MSKRRITHRQAKMIQSIHDRRVQRASQRDSALLNNLEQTYLGPEEEGLVIARYGARAEVESRDGHIVQCLMRQHIGQVVTGDNIILRRGQDGLGVIVALIPRRSELLQFDERYASKPIAANIDQLLIVVALEPAYSLQHLDPYLIAAELTGITPIIILNKIDLCPPPFPDELMEWILIYRNLGYQVIELSCIDIVGLDALKDKIQHKTSVCVGQSGVGKSSLLTKLLPKEEIRIGTFTPEVGHGTHTTSTTRLYHLSEGGRLIDSPGIRELKLGALNQADLLQGFIEFKPLQGQCKFRDCTHQHEPDCAILKAVDEGRISLQRLESFYKLSGKES